MSRFHFKKEFKNDLALLTETQSVNPFSVEAAKSGGLWEEVAANLKKSNLKLDVNQRGCKSRVLFLMKKFKEEETLSVKSSGVEEAELDALKNILTSLVALEKEMPRPAKKSGTYSKNGKLAANETRERALAIIEEGDDFNDGFETDDGPKKLEKLTTTQKAMDPILELDAPARKKSKANDEQDVVKYLKAKNDNENQVRLEELKIRALEADNKKFELQMQKEKQDAELKERTKMNELFFKVLEDKIK